MKVKTSSVVRKRTWRTGDLSIYSAYVTFCKLLLKTKFTYDFDTFLSIPSKSNEILIFNITFSHLMN